MRNIISRPFSTPKRNISGSVMASTHRLAQQPIRLSMGAKAARGEPSTVWSSWRTMANSAAAAVHSQPITYLLTTMSRVE